MAAPDSLPARLAPLLPALREAAREPLGLYLHWPFCRDRCTYCSFVTTRDGGLEAAVLARLLEEIRGWGRALGSPALDTLYLGGGTPSLLGLEALGALSRGIRAAFGTLGLAEATLEANPGTVDQDWLQGARRLGWDRVSLGVQSFDDALLARLGRIHDGAAAEQALRAASAAGFARRSADLILGIPGQRLSGVLEDAQRLADLGVTHLSIYMLDLDKACPLRAEVEAGRLALPSEDDVAECFEALQARLPALGLEPYEISNAAAPGEHSRHNLRYWERRPYLGLGPSAASHLGRWRWTASPVIPAWAEGRGETELQELDAAEELGEVPLLGLRLHQGVDWDALRARAERDGLLPLVDAWEQNLSTFHSQGLLLREGPRLRLTPRGMLLSNPVLQVFV
ncbi:MAG: coproporphyrinogen III oxidase family protein [Acidobacteria bacterium]|nr:coproporphyrinogen III oxidase family protein [Acidobacteriota bacterium]